MSPEINPCSGYDVLYKSMSEKEREQLQKDIEAVITPSAEAAQKVLLEGIQAAITKLYSDVLVVNPWPLIIKETSTHYEFISAIIERNKESIINTPPRSLPQVFVNSIIARWRYDNPDEFKKIVGEYTNSLVNRLEDWQKTSHDL